jgi:hypothetical protein
MEPVVRRSYVTYSSQPILLMKLCEQANPDLYEGISHENINGLKSYKDERYKKNKAIKGLKDRRSEFHCKIQMLSRMMGHMHGPEQTALMFQPVKPIHHEVDHHHQRSPIQPGILN